LARLEKDEERKEGKGRKEENGKKSEVGERGRGIRVEEKGKTPGKRFCFRRRWQAPASMQKLASRAITFFALANCWTRK
jgi:hypothetical protein